MFTSIFSCIKIGIIFVLSIPFSYALEVDSLNFSGTWQGIEVMGTSQVLSQRIKNIVPIEKGSTFNCDENICKRWCDKIKEEISPNKAECGAVSYFDHTHYYLVEVLPQYTENYRQIKKTGSHNKKLPPQLQNIFNTFEIQEFNNFKLGRNIEKGSEKLQRKDIQNLSNKLEKLVPKYNELILDVLTYSEDVNQRRDAAKLLTWTKDSNLQEIIDRNLMNDPDSAVRNNLSLSLSSYIKNLNDPVLIEKSLKMYCQQISLPSHGDRNKGLFSIQEILNKDKKKYALLDNTCIEKIKLISETSILPNVGGFAKTILTSLRQD